MTFIIKMNQIDVVHKYSVIKLFLQNIKLKKNSFTVTGQQKSL